MSIRVDSGTSPGEWTDGEANPAKTAVRVGENTLAQIASRLGVSAEDLQAANPEVSNPNSVMPGMELRLPTVSKAVPSPSGPEEQNPADSVSFAASKRMESDLDSMVMRTMLSSAWKSSPGAVGSGGITQQAPVADPLGGEGYSQAVRDDTTAKLRTVYESPHFKSLSPADKKTVLNTLAGNAPISQETLDQTLKLLGSLQPLSEGDRQIALDGFKVSHADSAYTANLTTILNDPKFTGLSDAAKTAVLSQVRNYPDARTAGNIDRMLQKHWFQNQSLDSQQRSLKTIARFSHNPNGNRQIIDNTLDKLLAPNSPFTLKWEPMENGLNTVYGRGGHNTLFLNENVIKADNDKMEENEKTDRLSLNTVAHEINHLLNHDVPEGNFKYVNAEYRAWYVGFQAQYGRVPTNQEAIEKRLQTQLDLEGGYKDTSKAALDNPAEAQKIFDFLKSITGMNVDANNWHDVVYDSNPDKDWPNLSVLPAPEPVGNNDNH